MLTEHLDTIEAALKLARREAERFANEYNLSEARADVAAYEAALAALSAEREMPEATYVPLPDGEYEMKGPDSVYILRVCYGGREIEAWSKNNTYNDGTPVDMDEIGIGDFRLCRRRVDGSTTGAQGGQ